jgi:GNAT superfamily N-acetyltransferase
LRMEIRKATLKDVKQLVVLWKGLMNHHIRQCRKGSAEHELHSLSKNAEGLWKKWLKKNIRSRNSLVLVAEKDGKLIAYSLNFIKENVKVYKVKRFGHMSDLYVEKGYRGKGIGSGFRKQTLAWFRKKGMRFISIASHACNPSSRKIYHKWGFFDYSFMLHQKL